MKWDSCIIILLLIALTSCNSNPLVIEGVVSDNVQKWQSYKQEETSASFSNTILINPDRKNRKIEGFGVCFDEMGWESMRSLSVADRNYILEECFAPHIGGNLNIGRVPMGGNDYSHDWYSYDDTEGDFDMRYFSIDRDRAALIPFIKSALKYNPNLKLWASPWSPPSWMKSDKPYLSVPGKTDLKNSPLVGKIGTMIQDSLYLQAYALYFDKYIDAYHAENIPVSIVMPQNEFNAEAVYPNCSWTCNDLANFINNYLAPVMSAKKVDIYIGVADAKKRNIFDIAMKYPSVVKDIKGFGFHEYGQEGLPSIQKKYSGYSFYQTGLNVNTENNNWADTNRFWTFLKYSINQGINAFVYPHMSLSHGFISQQGRRSNSLIVVDKVNKEFHFTPDYYLIKHFSHFIESGAYSLVVQGNYKDVVAFVNPDNRIIIIAANLTRLPCKVRLKIGTKEQIVRLKAQSFSTFVCH